MPVLDNARHEAFAQGMAKGLSASEAYIQAGYADSRSAASRLSTNVNIAQRVTELQQMAADGIVIDRQWVLAKLVENVNTCMMMEPVKDALGNVTMTVTHNPSAANKALELLGKEIGMFVDKHEVASAVDVTHHGEVSVSDTASFLTDALGAAAARPPSKPRTH